jgi:superfamily II DNA or RNA helicase
MENVNQITLRPYQNEFVQAVLSEWQGGTRATLGVAPTGSGKTTMAAEIAAKVEGRVMFLADARNLVEQAARTFERFGHGRGNIYMGDETQLYPNSRYSVGTVQTVGPKVEALRDYDYLIFDEAHRNSLGAYPRAIMERFGGARILGITATPNRTDRKSLGEIYQSIAHEIPLKGLIEDGYLARIKVLQVPVDVDLSGAKTVAGDISADDAGAAIEPHIEALADVWMAHGQGGCFSAQHPDERTDGGCAANARGCGDPR